MENFDDYLPEKFMRLPDGVVITNREGEILWFNGAFKSMCGYDLKEVKGRKAGSFLQGLKSDPAMIQNMRDAVNMGMPCTAELTNYHKDGHEYMVHITFEPVKRSNGTICYFAAIEREFNPEEIKQAGLENLELILHENLVELVEELRRDVD